MLSAQIQKVPLDFGQALAQTHQSGQAMGYFASHHEGKSVHYLMTQPALTVQAKNFELTLEAHTPLGQKLLTTLTEQTSSKATLSIECSPNDPSLSEKERLQQNKTFEIVEKLLQMIPDTDLLPTQARSLLGILGFDSIQYYEKLDLPEKDPTQFPDFLFFFPEHFYFEKHSCCYSITFGQYQHPTYVNQAPKPSNIGTLKSHTQDKDYESKVETLKYHIQQGDIFQAVLARRFSFSITSPISTFLSLLKKNKSPYSFFIKSCEHTLFGFSPETALRIEQNNNQSVVSLSPLAGTRALSEHTNMDKISADLQTDQKEQAEHMMLVDLARNDLARICLPKTRKVASLAQATQFGSIVHLRSVVQGHLAPSFNSFQALLACSPMGTLSGAPKIKAIELIMALEQERRGAYGGSVGLFHADGGLDTAIIIRSCVVHKGTAHVTSGAGIVKDSIPSKESDETKLKANSLLKSLFLKQEVA